VALLFFLLAVVAATAADALLSRLFPLGTPLVDPWLVLVMVVAVRHRPPSATLAGAAAGLVQDALSASLLGMHGFSKALAGYLCHALAGTVAMTRTGPRLLLAAAATLVERWALALLGLLLGRGFAPPAILPLLILIAGNAAAAVLVLRLLDRSRRWAPQSA